jgi:integrase
MATERLSAIAVKQAKARDKAYKLTDGGGLYLLIKPNSTKCWRFDYRFGGKRKTLSLGTYPLVELKEARDAHKKAKKKLLNQIDPAQDKRRAKHDTVAEQGCVFSELAEEWWNHQKGTWTKLHAERVWKRIKAEVLPYIGHMAIAEVRPQDLISIIRRVENRGALDTASRVLQDIGRICRYAVQNGRTDTNPSSELKGILKGRNPSHRDSLPRDELPSFLQALDSYDRHGRLLTKLAIRLLLLTFVRPGELRGARWDEFDLDQKLWRIPSQRMKMKADHMVPLSDQAVEVIERLREISGQYELLFPSERNRAEPMSDNTMRRAIFKLGYDGNTPGKSKAVPHGFRATASSILNERGYNPDAIERQLSHQERNGVRAAYTHHARYLEERIVMMQWWADFLDSMKNKASDALL